MNWANKIFMMGLLLVLISSVAQAQFMNNCYEINGSLCDDIIVVNADISDDLAAESSTSIITASDELKSENKISAGANILNPGVDITDTLAKLSGEDAGARIVKMDDLFVDEIAQNSGQTIYFQQHLSIIGGLDVYGIADLANLELIENRFSPILFEANVTINDRTVIQGLLTAAGAMFQQRLAVAQDLDIYGDLSVDGGDLSSRTGDITASAFNGDYNVRKACDERTGRFNDANNGLTFQFFDGGIRCSTGEFCEVNQDCTSGNCEEGVCQ